MSDKEKHARSVYGKTWIASRQMSKGEIQDHLERLEARSACQRWRLFPRRGSSEWSILL